MKKVTLVIELDHDYVIPDGAVFDPIGQEALISIGDSHGDNPFMTIVGDVVEYRKEEQENG